LSRRAARAAGQGKLVGVTATDSARVGLQARGRIGRRARWAVSAGVERRQCSPTSRRSWARGRSGL